MSDDPPRPMIICLGGGFVPAELEKRGLDVLIVADEVEAIEAARSYAASAVVIDSLAGDADTVFRGIHDRLLEQHMTLVALVNPGIVDWEQHIVVIRNDRSQPAKVALQIAESCGL